MMLLTWWNVGLTETPDLSLSIRVVNLAELYIYTTFAHKVPPPPSDRCTPHHDGLGGVLFWLRDRVSSNSNTPIVVRQIESALI